MLGIINLPTFILGSLFIILLPGPNSFYVLSTSAKFGMNYGYKAALGVVTGDSILILATVFGASTVLHTFPILFISLKMIGAIYLSYLGLKLIYQGIHTWKARHTVNQTLKSSGSLSNQLANPYRTALTISILNPKAIFFLLSFFIQFVDPNSSSPLLSFFILSVILQSMSIVYLTVLIFSGAQLAGYFHQHIKLASGGTCFVGLLFISFGMQLACSSLL